jgi:hypothetical protein
MDKLIFKTRKMAIAMIANHPGWKNDSFISDALRKSVFFFGKAIAVI